MSSLPERPLVIINSGSYAGQELVAEFGPLPPTFLPVGLGRLYELQAALLGPVEGDLHLTLPESFVLPVWDAERLAALGLNIIRTPDELSLGSALLYALGQIGFRDRPLRILHGDTVLYGLDFTSENVIAVSGASDSAEGYGWAQAKLGTSGNIEEVLRPGIGPSSTSGSRLTGYFAFSSAAKFAEKLALSGGDFYEALTRQIVETPVRAVIPAQWLDFGHVRTFFRSRRIITTERAFNSLQISEMRVRKRSSTAARKIEAEARWLRHVPSSVSPFCARLLEEGQDEGGYFYDTEYEYMPTLTELFVFGRLSGHGWERILSSCASFIDAAACAPEGKVERGELRRLVVDKTRSRMEDYSRTIDIDLDAGTAINGRPAPSLRKCLADIEDALADCRDAPSIMHGDFCFSNILYNFRTGRIRLIDPRGLGEDGTFRINGDSRYDLAKLIHSIYGRYDLIMAGHYKGTRTGRQSFELTFPIEPERSRVEEIAKGLRMGGVSLRSKEVWAAMTSLFMSMPPLHSDRPDRQVAFVANALRVHSELEGLS